MKRRVSKSFLISLSVLFLAFYFGASAYVSNNGLAKIFGDKINDDDLKVKDELYETINAAAFCNKEDTFISSDVSLDSQLTPDVVGEVANALQENVQLREISAKQKEQIDSFEKIGLILTNGFVSIYDTNSEEGKVLGKMFNGYFAKILSENGEWIQIKSGDVEGYIKGDNLVKGEDARAVFSEYVKTYATIKSDSELNVRKDSNEKSDTIAKVVKGEKYEVLKTAGDWLYISIGQKTKGYISSKYAQTSSEYATAISTSEEKKMLEAEKKALLRAKANDDGSTDADGKVKISYSGSVMSMNDNDFAMYVALIFSESGNEPYEGKVAVAQVILNRIKSGHYPNTLEGVVYQSGQFGPVKNGALNKNLNLYKNGGFQAKGHQECIKAAKEALNGADVIGSRTSFNGYNAEKNRGHKNAVKIGNHLFY